MTYRCYVGYRRCCSSKIGEIRVDIGALLGSFGLLSLPVLAGEQFRCSFSDHYARRHRVGRRYPRHDGAVGDSKVLDSSTRPSLNSVSMLHTVFGGACSRVRPA
jgi:hypothetical protein